MKSKKLLFAGLLIMAVGYTFTGCERRERPENITSVSIAPMKYFVDRLTGEAIDVNIMVPQGASHGTYSPSAAQMQKLSDSELYIRIGYLGYEQAFIRRLKQLNPSMKEVNLSDGVELIRGELIDHGDHVHEGGIDPHIWMSPKVMLYLLPAIKNGLIEVYPHLEETIVTNYPSLLEDVERVHAEMETLTQTLGKRRFMIFHPALTYLARDYNLEQVSIEFEGKEPSPARLSRLIREASADKIPVIFIQEEYDVRNANLVAAETGAEVVTINPMEYNWVRSMEELMSIFEVYLK
ncbi:MAG: zinc ABC transporter substrate-binding protein [Bacteroidetes bacterium]|nr:MAG: zinc ABC transporter substrate-binding protein [Bacteroidota bacterium]